MADLSFYYVQKPPLDRVLIKLLEKIYAQDERAVVASPHQDRIDTLNTSLWTYHPGSFLPHGTATDTQAADQPIWLTTQVENPNGASVLVLLDMMAPDQLDLFKRAMFVIDSISPEHIASAKIYLQKYKNDGHKITQWQQSAEGAWNAI